MRFVVELTNVLASIITISSAIVFTIKKMLCNKKDRHRPK